MSHQRQHEWHVGTNMPLACFRRGAVLAADVARASVDVHPSLALSIVIAGIIRHEKSQSFEASGQARVILLTLK